MGNITKDYSPQSLKNLINGKSHIVSWFSNKRPSAYQHFMLALNTVNRHYQRTHPVLPRFYNNKDQPLFVFGNNRTNKGNISIALAQKHSTVRIFWGDGNIDVNHPNFFIRKNRYGTDFGQFVFKIKDEASTELLNLFLLENKVPMFEGMHDSDYDIKEMAIEQFNDDVNDLLSKMTLDELEEKAKAVGNTHPPRSRTTVTTFSRNPHVAAYAHKRANGVCEECGKPAPFMKTKTGQPYLEVHHKKRLIDNGSDTEDNVIAVCPNCHRKLHDQYFNQP